MSCVSQRPLAQVRLPKESNLQEIFEHIHISCTNPAVICFRLVVDAARSVSRSADTLKLFKLRPSSMPLQGAIKHTCISCTNPAVFCFRLVVGGVCLMLCIGVFKLPRPLSMPLPPRRLPSKPSPTSSASMLSCHLSSSFRAQTRSLLPLAWALMEFVVFLSRSVLVLTVCISSLPVLSFPLCFLSSFRLPNSAVLCYSLVRCCFALHRCRFVFSLPVLPNPLPLKSCLSPPASAIRRPVLCRIVHPKIAVFCFSLGRLKFCLPRLLRSPCRSTAFVLCSLSSSPPSSRALTSAFARTSVTCWPCVVFECSVCILFPFFIIPSIKS